MHKFKFTSLFLATLFTLGLSAQVSVSSTGTNPDASAMLDVQSTDKGMLVPRMTTAQRTAISNPATGLLVFDTDTGSFMFYSGSAWLLVGSDNLGNHTSTQNILLNGNYLSNDGDNEGIYIDPFGRIGVNTNTPGEKLHIKNGKLYLSHSSDAPEILLIDDADNSNWSLKHQRSNDRFEIRNSALPSATFKIWPSGNVQIGSSIIIPNAQLEVIGTVEATNFVGNGSGLTGINGDNLGNHTAATTLNLATHNISNGGTINAVAFVGNGAGLSNVPGDNLGNHNATQNLKLNLNYLSGDGDNEGIYIDNAGNTGIGTTTPTSRLDVGGGNISLNGGWISNDGGNEGIRIDNNGRLGIGVVPNTTARFEARGGGFNDYYVGLFASTHYATQALRLFGIDYNSPLFCIENSSGDRILELRGNGIIGLGTNNPTQAKVVIIGSVSNTLSYGWLNSSGNTGGAGSPSTNPYSLYANERIAASEFNAHSDIRIKNIKGLSNTSQDLQTLMQIQVTDYTLRDTIAKGSTPQKKVIAQQVAEVYPQAVSKTLTDVVPDIYQRAEVHDGWIVLATDLKVGERVKLITEESADIYEVSAVENDRFQVQPETFNLQPETVFVYGREVNDFHTVDYEAIAMLNVSATQEQQRIIEEQQQRIEEQQKRIDELESQLAHQVETLSELKVMVEQLMQADAPAVLEASNQ